jgi:acetoin utilization deacetylase AcuC-like enzyme
LGVCVLGLGALLPVAYNMGESAEADRQKAADKALADAYLNRVKPIAEASEAEQTEAQTTVVRTTRQNAAAAANAIRVIEATADENESYRDAVRPPGPHAERMRAINAAATAGDRTDPVQ